MNTLVKWYIKFNQIFLWIFCKFLIRVILDVRVTKCDIEPSPHGRIFISNHITHLDPFILVGSLTWTELQKVSPIRPMLAKGYYYSPLFFLAYPIGCYPTRPLFSFLKRYAGTSAAIRHANHGSTLGIYPEGQRVKHGHIEPKYGVIKILESTKELDVYLIRMKRMAQSKRHFSITVVKDNSVSVLKNPQDIMDKIFALEHTD